MTIRYEVRVGARRGTQYESEREARLETLRLAVQGFDVKLITWAPDRTGVYRTVSLETGSIKGLRWTRYDIIGPEPKVMPTEPNVMPLTRDH